MRYLYHENEPLILENKSRLFAHPALGSGQAVGQGEAGDALTGLSAGHYLIHEQGDASRPGRERYLGIINNQTTVTQLTVGAFTSEHFELPLHQCRVPANYYVNLEQVKKDSTFRGYEQDYGDAIHPHVMASGLGCVDPAFDQLDPNWDSLSTDDIVIRLQALKQWWEDKGFAPLTRVASYTPSNSLVSALKRARIKVLHSIIPEQNWSDGHWVINHWGMINQPFYMGSEDFRKPVAQQGSNDLLAMTMNSYHLYLPHLVHFGDHVLSPSHFLRWHRSTCGGEMPHRFLNFLDDYLRIAPAHDQPFFLVAGFEFGRTFGTRKMSQHNQRGLEALIDKARDQNIVFATSDDVYHYYQAHIHQPATTVFHQRDYIAGCRIMDKPTHAGPSLGIESPCFKATFAHQSALPFYHYDYDETWSYRYDDVDAPRDYAQDSSRNITVTLENDQACVKAREPLARDTPIALWDHQLAGDIDLAHWPAPVLDDERQHEIVVLPAGFHDQIVLPIQRTSRPNRAEFDGLAHPLWRVQTIGSAGRRHCYLYLDTVLDSPCTLTVRVPRACQVECVTGHVGAYAAGDEVSLTFDDRVITWYRFFGLDAKELQPDADAIAVLNQLAQTRDASDDLALHQKRNARIGQWMRQRQGQGEQLIYDIDCFAQKYRGERSRAKAFDLVHVNELDGLAGEEKSDGGLAFGPGASFWVHPRSLHFDLVGLSRLPASAKRLNLYLHSFNPLAGHDVSYHLALWSGKKKIYASPTDWKLSHDPMDDTNLLRVALPVELLTEDVLVGHLAPRQRAVLDDWYRDEGQIAILNRLMVTL